MADECADPDTKVWTLGELLVIIVPGALITAAVPMADAAEYVGRIQVVQGVATAAALYVGPLLAGSDTTTFAAACLGAGLAGVGSVLLVRSLVNAAWGQPITCPCGGLFCVCTQTHAPCANLTPIVAHQAVVA